MRVYPFVVLGCAAAILSTGCDPLGSGTPASAGQDSAGGAQVPAPAPQEFDFVGVQAAGPLAWFGDGSKLLVAGVASAISGGGVVVVSPMSFVPAAGNAPTTPKTFTGPIFSVACDQGTNCYLDLVDGRILRLAVTGDTSEVALPGSRQFMASDNGRFIARPRIDSSGIELIDVTTKARLLFDGSSQTPLLGISPDGATVVEAAGTGISLVNVKAGTTTSSSLPQHAGWTQNAIIAAHWTGTSPHLVVLARWDTVGRSRYHEYDVDANVETLLGETSGTHLTVIGASWRPGVHRAAASVQTQCLQAQLAQCQWWQFDLLLFDNGTVKRVARVTGETLYIATLSPDGKTVGYLARGLSGTYLYLKSVP